MLQWDDDGSRGDQLEVRHVRPRRVRKDRPPGFWRGLRELWRSCTPVMRWRLVTILALLAVAAGLALAMAISIIILVAVSLL